MRKQFEIWVGHRYGGDDFSFDSEDETYDSWWVQDAWEIWQASRAALVVDLPPYVDRGTGEPWDHGYDEAIDDCKVTLSAAGITVKGEGE